MRNFPRLLFVLKRSYICYYMVCVSVPLKNVGVYKAFNSTELTLSFHRVYLCFPFDPRRTASKYNSIFYIIIAVFIRHKRFQFYYFQKDISYQFQAKYTKFVKGFTPWSPTELIQGLTVCLGPQLHLFPNSFSTHLFFLANAMVSLYFNASQYSGAIKDSKKFASPISS